MLEAADASQALAIHARRSIDILLPDVELPGMSGLELDATLRQSSPQLAVLFATGQMHTDAIADDSRTAVLLKPYGANRLAEAIAMLTTGGSRGDNTAPT